MTALKIESFKKLRGNLYEITLEDGKSYKLYDDIILRYELLLDRKLDKKKLQEVLEENGMLRAYYKGLKYITVKMRTEKEVKDYLSKNDFTNYQVGYAISMLKMEGYISPQNYARAYVLDSINLSLNGPKKIKDNLTRLGIEEEEIDKNLRLHSNDEWRERILKILNKKVKTNKVGESLFKKKMYQELIYLGYLDEDIRNVLNDFTLDTTCAFKKEADKVYSKLSSKYKDIELILRFKNKMFAKGFSSSEIDSYLRELGTN